MKVCGKSWSCAEPNCGLTLKVQESLIKHCKRHNHIIPPETVFRKRPGANSSTNEDVEREEDGENVGQNHDDSIPTNLPDLHLRPGELTSTPMKHHQTYPM